MKTLLRSAALVAAFAAPALAQEAEHTGPVNLLAPDAGLMFWTLIIFGIFFLILWRYAIPLLTDAVRAREQALRDALDSAKKDRADAERLLSDLKSQMESARAEAQKLIADGRATAEKMREQVLEDTRKQQAELLARAARDIDAEKTRAIAQLRAEAIDLAIRGAGRVIEKNLDDATNRKLVEDFLSTVGKR